MILLDKEDTYIATADLLTKAMKRMSRLKNVSMSKEERQKYNTLFMRIDRLVYELYQLKYSDEKTG